MIKIYDMIEKAKEAGYDEKIAFYFKIWPTLYTK